MMKEADSTVRPNARGDRPRVDPTAFIHPTAQIIGNVRIGRRVFVGPYAVIRADEHDRDGRVAPVVIGDDCNIQDGVIVHTLAGREVHVGRECSLSHGCIVHGPARLGEGCFVGFRAVVFRAELGRNVLVDTSGVVQDVVLGDGVKVPPGRAITSPEAAAALAAAPAEARRFMQQVVRMNVSLADGYRVQAGQFAP
ncbi:MAG: Carnitine operon protein CaiE [Phycisphaerae bacterium]|nr:Carnitine operon protein CaiE [Phycisphaerae bacterium]